MLGAERVWTARIRGDDEVAIPWPSLSLERLPAEMERNVTDLRQILDGAMGEGLAREVAYRNTAGDAFVSKLDDILTHVMLHGAYHRGQIAWSLRHAGGEPVGTDFIAMVRES